MNRSDVPLSAPEQLLRSLGVDDPSEIDVEAIAFHLGALVRYARLGGCSARIVGRGNKARIVVDRAERRERQRFSIGHELGHWYFDKGRIASSCKRADIGAARGRGPEERANGFAAELLLPRYLFQPRAQKLDVTLPVVETLASLFSTGLTATALRLVALTDKPAMIARYDAKGRRGFFVRSPSLPETFWPREELHEDTGGFELLFGSGKEHLSRPRTLIADRCTSAPRAAQFQIVESSLRTRGDIWSLTWWRDRRHLSATTNG